MKQQTASKASHKTTPDFFSTEVARARRFYLDLNPARRVALTVVSGGLEHCTTGYSIHRNSFPFHSIEYVARGRGELKLKGRVHTLEPGRLFSYGPGVPHHITGDSANPLVKYFVNFAGVDAAALLRSCGLGAGGAARVHPPNALRGLFDELIESGLRPRRVQSELCRQLLTCLVLKIRAAAVPAEAPEAQAFQTYQDCRDHMERHFQRLQTLEQVAEERHVNDAYLCRLFRRYSDQSPYQYLLRLKMTRAAEQLQQPGSLVKQVAHDLGYPDAFHFSRLFKSVFGVSPDVFRRIR